MIIGLFHPSVGGAEKECQKLSKRLIENGFSVTVLTQQRDGLPEYEKVDGIPVYRKVKGWHIFELTFMISVLHFLLTHRKEYDIIQCFGLYLFVPPALLMKYLYGKKVVARLECSGRFGDIWRINQLRWKKLIMVSARRIDKIIFISHEIKRELTENLFPGEKLIFISNSVNVDKFKPAEGHKNTHSKNLCFVGRIEEQKGLEYLIKSVDIIKSQEEGVRLFIVGDGQLRATLEELCKRLKLDTHIVFAGTVDDVLPYYQSARIFVLPSLSEGMPLTLLEAMSCGLPVVATSVGGNEEILDSPSDADKTALYDFHIGKHGILVKPRDVKGLAEAIVRFLRDEELSQQYGKRARKYVEDNFSQEKIINDYIKLYSSLL